MAGFAPSYGPVWAHASPKGPLASFYTAGLPPGPVEPPSRPLYCRKALADFSFRTRCQLYTNPPCLACGQGPGIAPAQPQGPLGYSNTRPPPWEAPPHVRPAHTHPKGIGGRPPLLYEFGPEVVRLTPCREHSLALSTRAGRPLHASPDVHWKSLLENAESTVGQMFEYNNSQKIFLRTYILHFFEKFVA